MGINLRSRRTPSMPLPVPRGDTQKDQKTMESWYRNFLLSHEQTTQQTHDDLVDLNDAQTALDSRTTAVEGDITSLDGRVTALEGIDASDLLDDIKTVDGSGSGLDADLLDGSHIYEIPNAKNWFINGGANVYQRMAPYTLVNNNYGYSLDRWAGCASGTAVNAGTYTQLLSPLYGSTGYVFHFSGVSMTGANAYLLMRYFMMSNDARGLSSKVASVSFKVYHDIGITIHGGIDMYTCDVINVFSGLTVHTQLGSFDCPSGVETTVKFENINMPSDASSGMAFFLTFTTGAITNKNVYVTDIQLEVGPKCTPFAWSDIATELARAQRYYEKSFDWGTAPADNAGFGGALTYVTMNTYTYHNVGHVDYKMRKNRTVTPTLYNPGAVSADKIYDNTGPANRAATIVNAGDTGFGVYVNNVSIDSSHILSTQWVCDAECV